MWSGRRWQLAIRWLAPTRRSGVFGSGPLQFNFLGDGRNGIAHLFDHRLQCIRGYIQPPGPGTNLNGLCQVDFIADRRMFDALHDDIPLVSGSTSSTELRSISPARRWWSGCPGNDCEQRRWVLTVSHQQDDSMP